MSKTSKRYVSLLLAFVMMFTTMFTSVSLAEAEPDLSTTPDISFRFDDLNSLPTSGPAIITGKSEGSIFTSESALKATLYTTGAAIVTPTEGSKFKKAIEITGTSSYGKNAAKSIAVNVEKSNTAVTVYSSTSGEAVKIALKDANNEESKPTVKTVRSIEDVVTTIFYVKEPGKYYIGFDTAAEGNAATSTKSRIYGIDIDSDKQEADFTVKLKEDVTATVKGDSQGDVTVSNTNVTVKKVDKDTSGTTITVTLEVDKLSDFKEITPKLVIPVNGYQNAIKVSECKDNKFTVTQKADKITNDNNGTAKIEKQTKDYIFVLEEKSSTPEKFEGIIKINGKYDLFVSSAAVKFVDGLTNYNSATTTGGFAIVLPSKYDEFKDFTKDSFVSADFSSMDYDKTTKTLTIKKGEVTKIVKFVIKDENPDPSEGFEGTIKINNKYDLLVGKKDIRFVDSDNGIDIKAEGTTPNSFVITLSSKYDEFKSFNSNSFSETAGKYDKLTYDATNTTLTIFKDSESRAVKFIIKDNDPTPADSWKITSKYINIIVSEKSIKLQDSDGNDISNGISIVNGKVTTPIAPKYGFFSWEDTDFGTSDSAHKIEFVRNVDNNTVTLKVLNATTNDLELTIEFRDIPITLKSSVEASDVADLKNGDTFIATFKVNGNTGFNNATFDITYPSGVVEPVAFTDSDNINDGNWLQGNNKLAFISKGLVNQQVGLANDGKIRFASIDADTDTPKLFEVTGDGTLLQVKFKVIADTKGDYKIGSAPISGTTRIFNFKPSDSSTNEIRTIIENNADFSLNGSEVTELKPNFTVKSGNVIVVNVNENTITATGKDGVNFKADASTSSASVEIEAKYFDENIADKKLTFTSEGNAKAVTYDEVTHTITVTYGNDDKTETYKIVLERKDDGDTPGPDEELNLTVNIGNLGIKIVSGSSIQLVENGNNIGNPIEITNSTANVNIPGKYDIDSWKNGDFTSSNNKYTVSYDESTKTLTIKEKDKTVLTIKFNQTVITLDVEVPTDIADLKADGTFIATFKISGNTGFNNATFNVIYPEGVVKPVAFTDSDNINDGNWLQGNEGAFISKVLVNQQVGLAKDGKVTFAGLDANMNAPELFEVTDNGTLLQVKFQVVKALEGEHEITVKGIDGSDRIFNFKPEGSSIENMLKSIVNGAKFTFKNSEEPDVPGKEKPDFTVKSGDVIVVGVTGNTKDDITATGKDSAKFEDITFDSATSTASIKIDAEYFDANIKDADLSFTHEGNAKTATYDKATNTITVTYGNEQTYTIKLERKDGGDTPDPDSGLKLTVSAGNFGINISGSSIQLTLNGENVGDAIKFSGSTVDITIPGKYGINSWNANSFTSSDSKYTVEYNEGDKILRIKENGETKLTINFTESAIKFNASTVDTSALTNGDTFLVTFAIDGNTGFNNLTFDITYNNEAIKPVAFDATEDAGIEDNWIQASNPAEPGAFITKEYIESQITENNGKIRIANVDWNIAADNEALYEITEDGTLLQVRFQVIDASKTSKVDMVGTGTDNRIFNYAPDSSSDLNNMVKADVTPIEELTFDGSTPAPSEGKVTVTPVGAKLEGEGEDQKAAYVYKQDGTFDVDFNIESNPGINSYKFTVTYNSKSVAPVLDKFNSTVEDGYAYYTDAEGNKKLMVTAANITSPEAGKLVISGTLPEGFEAKDGNKLFKLTFTTLHNEHFVEGGSAVGNPNLTFTVDEVKGAAAAERTLTVDDITPIRIHPMKGDINADDTTNMVDATRLKQYLAAKVNMVLHDEYQTNFLADINKDGTTNMVDATRLKQYLAARISMDIPDDFPDAE